MKIKHPDIVGVVYDVPADKLDDWTAQGWKPVNPPKKVDPPKTPPATE